MCCLPHARGGVSFERLKCLKIASSSPRPWGCFCCHNPRDRTSPVFPTPVGVFPILAEHSGMSAGLPHARGGVSPPERARVNAVKSSPRPWGCFSPSPCMQPAPGVFPTPVGVFLLPSINPICSGCLPHARGGVSNAQSGFPADEYVFPTPVGVFLSVSSKKGRKPGLPHARGGVSDTGYGDMARHRSSPRPWGCFRLTGTVGSKGVGLPHARGGVST